MAQWIGYMVSIKCTDDLGTFQGEILSATNTEIILTKAFCNGFPCLESEVKIRYTCNLIFVFNVRSVFSTTRSFFLGPNQSLI